MIGEKIQEVHGKTTGMRVLADGIETSFAGKGTLLGVATSDLGTYLSTMSATGVLHGTGHGMTMSESGDMLKWKAHGVGKPTGKGMGVSYRYSLIVETASPKWARLNGMLLVGEWEVDAEGNGHGQAFEWK